MTLEVDSYGAYLMKKDNRLVVKVGDDEINIDVNKVDTITLTKGTVVTTDALLWALNNNIDVIFKEKSGQVKGRLWNSKFGSLPYIRRKQLEFSYSSQAVNWIKKIILEKMSNQITILMAFYPDDKQLRKFFDRSINKIEDYKTKVKSLKADIITDIASSLRGWEGISTKTYFEAISKILPSKYNFTGRVQHPAFDLVNAMLNYSYGILYGKIESSLIKAGVDPYIGILHRENYNRPVLTFDVIEKFRFWADYVVISLVLQDIFDQDDYIVNSDGSVWIEGMSKRILIQAMYDYLGEIIQFPEGRYKRINYLDVYAQKLANMFKTFSSESKTDKNDNVG